MASNDLARLYKAKTVIENYYSVERSNEGFNKSADKECSAVTADEKAKIEKLNERIEKTESSSFLQRRGIIIIVVGVLLLALLMIGSRSFLEPVISPDVSIVVERYEDYVKDGGKAPKDYDADDTSSERETALTDAALPVIAGNIILVTLVLGFAAAMIAAGNTKKGDKGVTVVLGVGVIILLVSVVFIFMIMKHCRDTWGLHPTIGTLGIVFKGLWNTIFGIGKIFTVTYSYFLFVFFLQLIIYGTILTFIIGRDKYRMPKSSIAATEVLRNQIAELSADANKKRSAIREKWNAKKKNNPYVSAYFALPKYQQDYRTVTSLIWAIENGYAYDIPGARNYWDRKAHDAAVQQQLQQVQATADAALRAAQTPPDVTVNVTVWN